MEGIRIEDIRVQEEITMARQWFENETGGWLRYIDQEDQKKFREDGMWNDLLYVMIYVFRLYGHSQERTVRMAGLLCLLRCSGHLHELVQDGMVGVDKKVQYRLLVGDQIMAHALEKLAEDEAYALISYFAQIVIKMSEGMTRYLEKNQIDWEILKYTHAPWYEAAFYSATFLAHQTELQQKRASKLGFQLGMLLEAKRERIPFQVQSGLDGTEWNTLPEGWEKEALMDLEKKVWALESQETGRSSTAQGK